MVIGAGENSDATGVNGDNNNIRATDAGAAYVYVRNGESCGPAGSQLPHRGL